MVHACDFAGCNKSFSRRDRWANHRRLAHGLGGPIIRCVRCRNEFSSNAHLQRHFGRCLVRQADACRAAAVDEVMEQPVPSVVPSVPAVVVLPEVAAVPSDVAAVPVVAMPPDPDLDQFIAQLDDYVVVRRPTVDFGGQVVGCPTCPLMFGSGREAAGAHHAQVSMDGSSVIVHLP